MKREILKYVVCPSCKKALKLFVGREEGKEIMEGRLECEGCREAYPIRGGVPRLLRKVEDEKTQESFGFEWERMYDSISSEKEREIHQFSRKVGLKKSFFKGKLVLDAGCGIGRYSHIAAGLGAEVIAIDFSRAVDTAFRYTRDMPNVNVIQADIFRLPFREGTFDFIMSFGVLHHTPSTERAFKSLVPLVKKGGTVFIWLYAKRSLIVDSINDAIRALTTRLPHKLLYMLSYIPAPLGGIPVLRNLSYLVTFCTLPGWKMRANDNFDWYSPRFQYKHTCEEVVGWYRQGKFGDITVTSPTWFDNKEADKDVKVTDQGSGFPRALWWLLGRYMSVGVRGVKK